MYISALLNFLKKVLRHPWWSRVKNLPTNAGDSGSIHGFDPWSGKIPHAVEQLNPSITTTEPTCATESHAP